MSPSALPWWGWLTCSLICLVAYAISMDDGVEGCGCGVVTLLVGLAGLITGGLAIVRFVKWVWVG
jgi:hypothetical protein